MPLAWPLFSSGRDVRADLERRIEKLEAQSAVPSRPRIVRMIIRKAGEPWNPTWARARRGPPDRIERRAGESVQDFEDRAGERFGDYIAG